MIFLFSSPPHLRFSHFSFLNNQPPLPPPLPSCLETSFPPFQKARGAGGGGGGGGGGAGNYEKSKSLHSTSNQMIKGNDEIVYPFHLRRH